MQGGVTSAVPIICAKCQRQIDMVAGQWVTVIGADRYHLGCAPGRSVDDNSMRLRRIKRDLRDLESDLREQASGSQDGYLLGIADRIRSITA